MKRPSIASLNAKVRALRDRLDSAEYVARLREDIANELERQRDAALAEVKRLRAIIDGSAARLP